MLSLLAGKSPFAFAHRRQFCIERGSTEKAEQVLCAASSQGSDKKPSFSTWRVHRVQSDAEARRIFRNVRVVRHSSDSLRQSPAAAHSDFFLIEKWGREVWFRSTTGKLPRNSGTSTWTCKGKTATLLRARVLPRKCVSARGATCS